MFDPRRWLTQDPWVLLTGLTAVLAFVGGFALVVLTAPTLLPAGPAPAARPAAVQPTPVQARATPPHPAAQPKPTPAPATPTPQPAAPTPAPTTSPLAGRQMTFLLLGLDRHSPGDPGRTDALVIGSVDFQARRASLISIPRDLIVTIPGYGEDRINTAFSRGELARLPGGGGALVRRTVEQNFQVTIDHYAAIDFDCFRAVIDGLGGVTIEVPQRIVDYLYPLPNDRGVQTVVFEPGVQKLNGERALQYVRMRSMDNDFRRMGRQQQLLLALSRQLFQPGTITALPTLVPAMVQACGDLSSDLNLTDWLQLAFAARDLAAFEVEHRVIDERLVRPYTTPAGAAVLLPNWPEIHRVVRQALPTLLGSN